MRPGLGAWYGGGPASYTGWKSACPAAGKAAVWLFCSPSSPCASHTCKTTCQLLYRKNTFIPGSEARRVPPSGGGGAGEEPGGMCCRGEEGRRRGCLSADQDPGPRGCARLRSLHPVPKPQEKHKPGTALQPVCPRLTGALAAVGRAHRSPAGQRRRGGSLPPGGRSPCKIVNSDTKYCKHNRV